MSVLGVARNQLTISRINNLARRLKPRGLDFDGVQPSYVRSTTLSLYRQGLYNPDALEQLSESLSVLAASENVKEGRLDVKRYLKHLLSTYARLEGPLAEEERISLIEEKLNQFIEIPLKTKLVERNSAMLNILSCKNENEVASMTVEILQRYFDGAHPTFVLMNKDNNNQQFLTPTEIALNPGLKNWAEGIMKKKLGEFHIPISMQSSNFYVQTFIKGETYREDNITRTKLIGLACDFLAINNEIFEKLIPIVFLPTTNSYLMIPLKARDTKLGIVTFLKKKEMLTANEQKEIENFLKLVAYTISFMRAEKELEELVEERTAKIQRMERQMTRMGLAAGMAHIGKNKLNVILGYLSLSLKHAKKTRDQLTELLGELVENKDDVDMKKVIETVIATHERSVSWMRKTFEAAHNYLQIIDQFLEYAKPAKLDLKMVNPKEIIEKIMEDVPVAGNIQVIREFEGNLPEIAVDLSFFGPVVEEIIRNAMEEFEKLEGEKIIKLGLKAAGQDIHFIIWNSSTRLPNGEADKIFDPFMSTKGSRGTGLGLATAAKIIDDHGWHIKAIEEKGGVSFIIEIPIK